MKSGEVIQGKYRLDKRLGVGGMGEVWRATHTGTGREFAVKFMHPHVAVSAVARDRFAREARASAQINHPSIVDVLDVGEHDEGALYLVMELLDGMLLVDALDGDPPLSIRDFLTVMQDVAEALAAAHAAGIVHRDIKPDNIFLHRDRASGLSVPKVLDFGIGKFAAGGSSGATATGAVLGSPRYMSPEQSRSASSVDGRSDLWACGVLLFEALTGTRPHEGDSYSSLILAVCTTPPASIDQMVPELPEALRSIVRDCLKPIELRIASAGELAARLAFALEDPALAWLPIARPLSSSGPGAPTTGLRFRASGAMPSSNRAQLSGPPSSGRASLPGPLFKPVTRTVPISLETQEKVRASVQASTEKKQKAKGFEAIAQTEKLDPAVLIEAAAIAEAKRLARDAAGPISIPIPLLSPRAPMASQPYPVAPPPRAPMASQPYPVASPPPPLARQPTLGSGVAATSPRSSGGLQIMAVVLALALVGILAAIVVQLRSTAAPTPPGSVPVTAPSP
jgi:serine/threonine-protein kinase